MIFQAAKAVGQNVRRDMLERLQKLLIRLEAPKHHVADDQQRPAVSKHLDGSIQRTHRAPLRPPPLLWHLPTVAYCYLQLASNILHTGVRYATFLG